MSSILASNFPWLSSLRPENERAAATVALSVGLHVLLGWAVLHMLIERPLPVADEPMTIEIAPPMAMPAPAAPEVTPDRPQTLPERERSELAPPKPETDPSPPAPPAQPPAVTGPVTIPGPPSPPAAEPAAAPRPTYRANVDYPARARTAERNGVAVVEVLVAAGGSVADVRIVSETPGGYGFGEAAMKSVRQWRFETAQPGVYRVTVRFKLD